jgi:hypothetical protein
MASISSPARPKIKGSPDFSRTTVHPFLSGIDEERMDLLLRYAGVATSLPDTLYMRFRRNNWLGREYRGAMKLRDCRRVTSCDVSGIL